MYQPAVGNSDPCQRKGRCAFPSGVRLTRSRIIPLGINANPAAAPTFERREI